MKIHNTLVMATFSLLSALISNTGYAQAAPTQSVKPATIPISSLPFTITAPGTYVLSSNLSFTTSNSGGTAISIASNIQGPVTLNLNGHTLSGGVPSDRAIVVYPPNEGPMSVKNGTITNFGYGLDIAGNNVDISNLTFSNIQLAINATCIIFAQADSCTVRNCTFSNAMYGIADGGLMNNRYTNLIFTNVTWSLFISGSPVHVGNCQFESSD